MAAPNLAQKIKHVFVLMLENRSFDHMLGFSGITGTDAVSGKSTQISGLTGTETNACDGRSYQVFQPADWSMPVDPCHEFLCVVEQLCGQNAFPHGGPYPPIGCGGFAANYAANRGLPGPGEIMKCYDASQLPVLTALAKEFVICDNWFSSIPGPTWPNRYFVHAASSGGLDHSPSNEEILLWFKQGVPLQNGTLFDKLNAGSKSWRIYRGDEFPQSASLKSVHFRDTTPLRKFRDEVAGSAPYPYSYTFIEPNYGDFLNNTYRGGTSQHPLDNVVCGEWLIKYVYESIRRSPAWNESLLIVSWDEHGGFYDHTPPGRAVAPGDNSSTSPLNKYGFGFDQLGVRVPAIVVSPLVSQNMIDHRIYDHASVPATVEAIFGLTAITQRDARANNVSPLITLASPRSTPEILPSPVSQGAQCPFPNPSAQKMAAPAPHEAALVARPLEPPNEGNLPGFLNVAQRIDLELTPPQLHADVVAKHRLSVTTRANAKAYIEEVRMKVRAAEGQ
jgi:phospholipase C